MKILDPILLNDWHPVASIDEFEHNAIVGTRLLGEDIVLWKEGDHYHAWQDLCIHRGTKLSLGSIKGGCLACPYHGWRYDGRGSCVLMPAHPDQVPPAKAKVKTYAIRERYGLLWVCMGEPERDVSPFPESDVPGFVIAACEPARNVQASGPRLIENFLDAAHFPFVHGGVLGDENRPEIGDYQAHIGLQGVESEPVRVYQPDPFGGSAGTAYYTYHAFRPLTAHFTKETSTITTALMLTITPHDERDSTAWFIVATPNARSSAELKTSYTPRILKIFEEDRQVVEAQRPELLPLDLQEELHLRSDRVAIAYRTWLRQLGLSFGVA